MLERISETISGPDTQTVGWKHSPSDIVDGVEGLFSAIKDREENEQKILEDVWEVVKNLAELAGEAFTWPIELGVAGAFFPFAAIGAGYAAAVEDIKKKETASGFPVGLAMGIMAETPDNVRGYFWRDSPGSDYNFDEGNQVAQYYYDGALAVGFANGRDIRERGLSAAFFADVKPQMTDTYGDPDKENWGRRQWIDFYIDLGAAFSKGHITQ